MPTHLYERTYGSDEWYTPRWITDALGHFDLDPCAAPDPQWQFADTNWTKEDNGLDKEWFGRVFCNPPYSRILLKQFIQKMIEHNNGLLLVFARFDNKVFQDLILPNASSMLLIRGRLRFSNAVMNAGSGSVIFSFGGGGSERDCLKNCEIPGFHIDLNHKPLDINQRDNSNFHC